MLRMLFPENGNNHHRSIWYCTICDFSDSKLHDGRTTRSDKDGPSRREDRKDHVRRQLLRSHWNLYNAHNWRFKEKYMSDASMADSGRYRDRRPLCEHPYRFDCVLHKWPNSQRRFLAQFRTNCYCDRNILVAGGIQLSKGDIDREDEYGNGSLETRIFISK